ncbi:glycosyltransferase [Cellulomonas sp. NS3]|uniref:glycosyltransferase n=1 Tax=Cellulomonas sp. NS3 TaxID=2973977 RepID=UPI00216338D5|nr:glycosyltransferase [Cellulomonas sp. NS3]
MRIAMVSEHASPLATLGGVDAGGQNVHVAALAEHLARLGHRVDVYTRRDDASLPRVVEMRPGVRVVHVSAGPARALPKDELLPYMTELGDELAREWREHGAPDVVHAHFWMSGLAALRAAAVTGPPVVQTFHALGSVKRRHQGERDTSPAGRADVEAQIARTVTRVVATCTDELAELVRLGVPASRVSVVPCGVDVTHFRPPRPEDAVPPLQDGRFRMLSVGRLVERKGVDNAVRALPLLPDVELAVVGGPAQEEVRDDPEGRRLWQLAVDLRVEDRVRFLGRVAHDDMPAVLRSAHVVVATPWYEPFGIVPLEAAACGRPVVASAVGGMLDTVQDGTTGVLVPPRDALALARAVRSVVDDPEHAVELGTAARRRAVRRYGWDRVAQQTARVYRELLSAGRVAHVVEEQAV